MSASTWSTRAWSGSVGKIFHGESLLYQFDLLPEQGHKRPAFINLQQFYAEAYLVDRVEELPEIILRWRNRVIGLEQRNDHVILSIDTPDGPYRIAANYVVACDGARSSLRQMVGAEFAGQVFEDQFLIADVKMTAEFPTERWFWFDPPFHAGRSALLHRQPDDVWRIDLQLDRGADPAVEKQPEIVRPRIARMLGHDRFDFEWISLYKFQCRRMAQIHPRPRDLCRRCRASGFAIRRPRRQFRAGGRRKSWLETRPRAATGFAGSAAGKLSRRTQRRRPTRTFANRPARPISWRRIRHYEARLRKAVLSLAKETEFGKRMVNGGRLSVPSVYETPLSTAGWRGVARRSASRGVDAGCADNTSRWRGRISHRSFHQRRERGLRCSAFATGRRSTRPSDVGAHPYRRRGLLRSRGPCRHTLRCETRHRLSAAAGRLCRRALPTPDAAPRSSGAGARIRHQLRSRPWRCRPVRILQSPMTRFA